MLRNRTGWLVALIALLALAGPARAEGDAGVTRAWALAEFGTPQFGPDMPHWPYANPDAPKGGSVTLGAFGSYDSLNTFILKGLWPRSLGLVSDSLMVGSADELSTVYGLIASSVEYPADRSSITFNLRPEARYHDGSPITADDFAFTIEVIRRYGRPFLQSFYDSVDQVEVENDHRFTVRFKKPGGMKPLVLVAQLSPTPRRWWNGEPGREITETTLTPPLTSGPYRIDSLDPGRSITYARVPDYWAKDLNINRGLHNFASIRYDYFNDDSVMFEAFVGGKIDYWQENRAQRWTTQYDFPDVGAGRVVKTIFPNNTPEGTQGFFFNLRRPPFDDRRVRAAIITLFDFEWTQKTLLNGQYARVRNFFINSDFGHDGEPDGAELALLTPLKDRIPPEVFGPRYQPPVTDGSGQLRQQLRESLRLMQEAGWAVENGRLMKDGRQMRLEILLVSAGVERLAMPFIENLKRIGIDASVRTVDVAQYERRVDTFDFDLLSVKSNFFPPPGPELRSYYGSATAGTEGTANWSGISDPAVDSLIESVLGAATETELKAATRALDRVLSFGLYYVPQWYNPETWVAYWNRFDYPERLPQYGNGFPTTWWVDPAKAAALPQRN